MKDYINSISKKYFKEICKLINGKDLQIVIIIHILPDIKQMLATLSEVVDIPLIIGVPYSTNTETLNYLQKDYKIICPKLNQILDAHYLKTEILHSLNPKKKTVIMEIGGYSSTVVKILKEQLGDNFLGVIEDTEAGHRRYETLEKTSTLPCPIVSIARSALKEPEDFLVGASCLYSTEIILRNVDFLWHGTPALVMGFGKIGRGVAYALRQRNNPIYVYDVDPIKNIQALSEGFQVPSRETVFKKAGIIYGATGRCSISSKDFERLKNGVTLVSCSSKQLEFDMNDLTEHYKKTAITKHVDLYKKGEEEIYVLADGKPVNFANSVMIGPLLILVLAEMMFAINTILEEKNNFKIIEVPYTHKQILAEKWSDHFLDPETGAYE